MDRRAFIKSLGIGTGLALVKPTMLADAVSSLYAPTVTVNTVNTNLLCHAISMERINNLMKEVYGSAIRKQLTESSLLLTRLRNSMAE